MTSHEKIITITVFNTEKIIKIHEFVVLNYHPLSCNNKVCHEFLSKQIIKGFGNDVNLAIYICYSPSITIFLTISYSLEESDKTLASNT